MPIYEYDCPECGRFEVLQKISEAPLKHCPLCSGKGKKHKVSKAISAAAFHLKGTGWYKTDYASGGGGNGSSKEKKSHESKPAPDAGSSAAAAESKPKESKPDVQAAV